MHPFPRRSINNDRQINSLQFHIQRDDIDMKYEKKKSSKDMVSFYEYFYK